MSTKERAIKVDQDTQARRTPAEQSATILQVTAACDLAHCQDGPARSLIVSRSLEGRLHQIANHSEEEN